MSELLWCIVAFLGIGSICAVIGKSADHIAEAIRSLKDRP